MKITDRIIADVLTDMVIISDTREQKNQHILDYFDDKEIKYRLEKLPSADYSVVFPNFPDFELDFSILIEKKNSLDEIAGNFTKGRERFVNEFERIGNAKIHLLIENATWRKVKNGTYRSKLPAQNMLASLMTWHFRYDCPIWFVSPPESGYVIYNIFKYSIMEKLKSMRT